MEVGAGSLKTQTFPEKYNELLDEKVAKVKSLFSDVEGFPSDIDVHESVKVQQPVATLSDGSRKTFV